MARVNLPVFADTVIPKSGISSNGKLGGAGATYRAIGCGSGGGTCPKSCAYLPESRGGMSTSEWAARLVAESAGYPLVHAAAVAWSDDVLAGRRRLDLCYVVNAPSEFSARRAPGLESSTGLIPGGIDVRLHVSGDFLRADRAYDAAHLTRCIDWEYVAAVCEFARVHRGVCWVYTHVHSVKLWNALCAAGVQVWISCDTVRQAVRWLRRGACVTMGGPIDYLRAVKASLDSVFGARFCPWDLSKHFHGEGPRQISCRGCRLCIDEIHARVILFVSH